MTGDIEKDQEKFNGEDHKPVVEVKPNDGKVVIDFGNLDKDKEGNEKPKDEHVDHVILDVPATDKDYEDTSVIQAPTIKDSDEKEIENATTEVKLDGKELTGTAKATGKGAHAHGILAKDSHVHMTDVGNVSLTAEATGNGGSATALLAEGKNITIENNKDSVVTLKANDKAGEGNETTAVLQTKEKGNITITGKVDISSDTKGKTAVGVSDGSKVAIGGGKIVAGEKGAAIEVIGNGKVEANVGKTAEGEKHGLNIKGDIHFGEKPAKFNLRRIMVMAVDEGDKAIGTFSFDGKEDSWEGNYTGSNADAELNLTFANGASWTGAKQSVGSLDLTLNEGAEWFNTSEDATVVEALRGTGGIVHMNDAKDSDVKIGYYNGETTFIYNHDDKNNILGGKVEIEDAEKDSVVNVKTSSINTNDKEKIEGVLVALAEKLYAGKDAIDDLKGQVQIEEGMVTGYKTLSFGDIQFSQDGKASIIEGSINYGKDDYTEKVETAMMKGAKSAMTASAMMWRSEANDLMKRMGDLRMAEGEEGIWAKYYNTKQEMDAQNTKYTNSYKAYQLGYDKKVGNWTVGAAASYGDGESTYASGRGENSVVSLGLYGAWNGKDGQYVDLILKRSKLDNEFTINGGEAIGEMEADYNTWATSISAEYGKRFETNKGFYVEPSAEFTLGRVDGTDYETSTTKAGKMTVQQDDYDTLVGRLGLRVGQKLAKASYYAKLAVAKEFCGDYETKYADQYGNSNDTSMSFGDTWYEMQIGGTAQLNDNSYIYASYERNFGADVEQKWRIDAGLRFSF